MSLSCREAAELVGMSKPGIVKAVKTGKLSASKDVHGQWAIDPTELFRVYEAVGAGTQPSLLQDAPGWQVENKLLREMLLGKDDVIADLRERLDTATAQLGQLSAVIAQLTPPKAKAGWWARLLGG